MGGAITTLPLYAFTASTWIALPFYLYGKSFTSWYNTQLSRQPAASQYIHPSFWRGLSSETPHEKRKSRESSNVPENSVLVFFNVSLFFAESLWWERFFFSCNSLNIMQYGSKTCSRRWNILMLLSIDGYQWCIFVLRASPKFVKPRSMNPRKARDERTGRSYLSRLVRKNLLSSDARHSGKRCFSAHVTGCTVSNGRMNLND